MSLSRYRRQLPTVEQQRLVSLAQSERGSLSALMSEARQAWQMLDAIRPLLPPSLGDALRAGRWDGGEWTITAPSGAAASKLQQMRPMIEATLREKGWKVSRVQVRVQGG